MSKIQWTDKTDNPLKRADGGNYCELISLGCANCYASTLNSRGTRFGGNGQAYRGSNQDRPEMILNTEMLAKWARMTTPKKHFVGSMTDIFGEWVGDNILSPLFEAMLDAPKQTFQILTKRPARMSKFLVNWLRWQGLGQLPPNIWLGSSAEDQQRFGERLPWLTKALSQTRFLSLEPLLGPIELYGLDHIHWVIVGGESGKNARPLDLEWIEDIITQCRDANIPVFVKQLGTAWAAEAGAIDRKGGNPDEWPNLFRIRMMPRETWPELCEYCGAYWVDPDQERLCDDCLELA